MSIEQGKSQDIGSEKGISPELGSMEPKVLLFDLGHVFLDASYRVMYEGLERFGIPPEKTRLIFATNEYSDFTRGKIDAHTLCEALRGVLGTPDLTDDQMREVHDRHITGVVPGMLSLLERVTQKKGGENVVFVTDACAWQTVRQRQLIDLSGYRVISSSEIGMLKSDPEVVNDQGHRESFFLYVLDELGMQPQEGLLIDDSPDNIEIARRYGIQAFLFEGKPQLEDDLTRRGILE